MKPNDIIENKEQRDKYSNAAYSQKQKIDRSESREKEGKQKKLNATLKVIGPLVVLAAVAIAGFQSFYLQMFIDSIMNGPDWISYAIGGAITVFGIVLGERLAHNKLFDEEVYPKRFNRDNYPVLFGIIMYLGMHTCIGLVATEGTGDEFIPLVIVGLTIACLEVLYGFLLLNVGVVSTQLIIDAIRSSFRRKSFNKHLTLANRYDGIYTENLRRWNLSNPNSEIKYKENLTLNALNKYQHSASNGESIDIHTERLINSVLQE